MNRISAAFSVPSAFAASLLLAACAPDSLTSSDSSRPLVLADTAAAQDSIGDPGTGGASRDVATIADTVTAMDTVVEIAEDPSDSLEDPDASRNAGAASVAAKALEGTWKRTGHLIEPGITLDGVFVSDLLMQDAIASRDNLTAFKAGGIWTEDEGAMKTDPATVQSEDGAWSLDAAGEVLSLRPAGAAQGGDHFDFKILELSATTLKVATVSGDYSDGRSHTETITFTRQ